MHISGEDGSGGGSKTKRSDSSFHAVPMEYISNHPTMESNPSQKELLNDLRPNDSAA